MNRRHMLAGIGTVGLASLSGCLGVVGMANHESAPAGVEAGAREETRYEQTAVEEIGVEREVPGGGLTGTVSVTNHMTKHEKRVELPPLGSKRAAVFHVLTTPKVKILGQQLNPVEEKSSQELVDLVRSNYDAIDNVSHEGDVDVTVLEQSTTQSRYTADAKFDGQSVRVNLHITEAVEAEGDLLVTIGVYPEDLQMREKPNVSTLAEAVTTEVDESASAGGNESDDGGNESGDSKQKGSDGNESGDGILG